MNQPDWLRRLSDAERAEVLEAFEERAAIREFEGGMPRFQAELEAWKDVARSHFDNRGNRPAQGGLF